MPSHMSVQSFATSRNSQVEFFINFVLEEYCQSLFKKKQISEYLIESQKHYESEIASDVWDHFVSFYDNIIGRNIELWCQTTCYKGNKAGKPEPNKTYEVRETLVEGISFRQYINESSKLVRSIHFTVGPKKYTYDWFPAAKKACYDLSLYIDIENIFDLIADQHEGVVAEFQVVKNLKNCLEIKDDLGEIAFNLIKQLQKWHLEHRLPKSDIADMQYKLVESVLTTNEDGINSIIEKSGNSGQDIKTKCNNVVHGAKESDPLILKTTQILLEKNPFIKIANGCITDWEGFSSYIENIKNSAIDYNDFLKKLWNNQKIKLVIRRLLLRIKAIESINYIQDIDVPGITEHNLYNGEHSDQQLFEILKHIDTRLSDLNINNLENLFEELISKSSKTILRSSVWFEARNGTALKPSFHYIQIALRENGYLVENPSKVGLRPLGYHATLAGGSGRVKAYTNLKVILEKSTKELLGYLKGKYFRPPEFPRRCKEEAFIGLTLKHRLSPKGFNKNLKVPLIMFIDMPENFQPPEYALRRLQAFGWDIAFNLNDIIAYIKKKNN